MRRRGTLTRRRQKWLLVFGGTFFILGALAASCRQEKKVRVPASGDAHKKQVKVRRDVESTRSRPFPSAALSPAASRPVTDFPACLYGCPNSERGTRGRLLEREGWVLFNNPKTKFADWAAYRVSPSTIGRSRPREWKADPDLAPEETLEPEDFRGAHAALQTDRGHQVPLASFSGTRNYEPLNYMSNVTPQRTPLNQKLWNLLEQAERQFVLEKSAALYVVTGPLYERPMPPLPGADEEHTVPSGYFKVLAFERGDDIDTAAVIAEQETGPGESYCEHRVTIDEVEARAVLDIFPLLPDDRARELESQEGSLFSELGCEDGQ